MTTDIKRYLIMTIGAAIGLVASFMQMIEKLILVGNKDAVLSCNIDSIFSCSTVLSAWQSSVFGFPNSLMCVAVFALFLGIGLVGLTGGRISKGMRILTQGIALFFLAFGLWFIYQSTYVIEAICIFCVFCLGGLLMVNGALWRLNFSKGSNDNTLEKFMRKMSAQGLDTLLWVTIAMSITLTIIFKFYV